MDKCFVLTSPFSGNNLLHSSLTMIMLSCIIPNSVVKRIRTISKRDYTFVYYTVRAYVSKSYYRVHSFMHTARPLTSLWSHLTLIYQNALLVTNLSAHKIKPNKATTVCSNKLFTWLRFLQPIKSVCLFALPTVIL